MRKRKKEVSQSEIVTAIHATGGVVSEIAETLGIPLPTLSAKIANSEKLQSELKQARLNYAEDAAMLKIRLGDTKAITFILETLGKERGYTKQKAIDIGYNGKQPEEMTDEELLEFAASLGIEK